MPRQVLTSVGWINVHDGCLLAVRTRGRDRYYLPGGKPEAGEDHVAALMREVYEELGVTLQEIRPAFAVTAPAHGAPAPTDLVMHCFYAGHSGDPVPGREIDALAWLTMPADLRAAPAVQIVLSRLAAEQ